MAYDFDGNNATTIALNGPFTTLPSVGFTFSCLVNARNFNQQNAVVFGMASDTDNSNYHRLILRSDGNVRYNRYNGGNSNSIATSNITANNWWHITGLSITDTDARVYINGGSEGINTGNRTPSGINRVSIGQLVRSTNQAGLDGHVAECVIWNAVLSAEERTFLGTGPPWPSPLSIRPDDILFYAPLVGTESEVFGDVALANPDNRPTSEHPPVTYPYFDQHVSPLTAAAIVKELSGTASLSGNLASALKAVHSLGGDATLSGNLASALRAVHQVGGDALLSAVLSSDLSAIRELDGQALLSANLESQLDCMHMIEGAAPLSANLTSVLTGVVDSFDITDITPSSGRPGTRIRITTSLPS